MSNKRIQMDNHHLYHFTSRKNADSIKHDGYIKANFPHNGQANMPFGVYLTQETPYNKVNNIFENNFDDLTRNWNTYGLLVDRLEVAFKFKKQDLIDAGAFQNTKTNRNEWIFPKNLSLDKCVKIEEK